MEEPPYIVIERYSFESLVDLLARYSDKEFVLRKSQSEYFKGYFEELHAETIVVENRYVDHDYLEDFTAYYVRCFRSYSRKTRRLHFFSVTFSEADFADAIRGENKGLIEAIKGQYLGFVVLKPLPQTVVGRTCLRTYPADGGRRQFPILREYKANLFGIDLTVDTIAFQEQDRVVAACATSALWSAFQATGPLFHHAIPSPAEITKTAARHIPDEYPSIMPATRGMPNDGLTATQMAHAIRGTGLEAYLVGARDSNVLKVTVYAYLRAQIPVIMGIALHEAPLSQNSKLIGKHAVAITGYSLGHQAPQTLPKTGVRVRALRIDKIYVHDDQVGPFARMDLRSDGALTTSLGTTQGLNAVAIPVLLLIPLYHKIRIPFWCIHDTVHVIGILLDSLLPHMPQGASEGPEWDIYLTTVSQLKSEILASQVLDPDTKSRVLVSDIPKYVWRASALITDQVQLDLLFDATDIEQGGAFITAIEYDPVLGHALRLFVQNNTIPNVNAMVAGVFSYFAQH